MIISKFPPSKFNSLTRSILGMEVTLPWKGHASAVFLELGRLTPREGRQRHDEGQACIWLVWEWRVEKRARILYGSANSDPEIDDSIRGLRGTKIRALRLAGQIPELVIELSNGQRVQTMTMWTGDPEWNIRLPDRTYLSVKAGALCISDGDADESDIMTNKESAVFALADACLSRWGKPAFKPKAGNCANCGYYVRLDGTGRMLDYGVCAESRSPFDGRVVNRESGCPMFAGKL